MFNRKAMARALGGTWLLALIAVSLAAAACSSAEPTPVPPTATTGASYGNVGSRNADRGL